MQIARTLALMAQPKDARLTHELARDVCERAASTAIIEGSIDKLGNQYVLGLRAINCRNGDVHGRRAGSLENKYVIFLIAEDTVNKVPLAIYLFEQ